MKQPKIPVVIYLTKNEVEALKDFCDNNLARGSVEIRQIGTGISWATKVQVRDLPETLTDITDYDSW